MTDRATKFDRADYSARDRGAVPSDSLDRILEAMSRSEGYLLPAARAKLASLYDRDTLLCLALLVAVWGGLQFTAAGWIADGLLLVAGLTAWLDTAKEFGLAALQAKDAESDAELDEAAKKMAGALTEAVIDGLIAWIGGRAFNRLRTWVKGVRARLLGRRFVGSGEQPLTLPGTALVGLERSAKTLGDRKKQFEKEVKSTAWIIALVGGLVFVGGTIVYIERAK